MNMNGHATGDGELLVTDMALEVPGLLVLDEYLLVVEFAIAVIAPVLGRRSLLLSLTHISSDPSRIDDDRTNPLHSDALGFCFPLFFAFRLLPTTTAYTLEN